MQARKELPLRRLDAKAERESALVRIILNANGGYAVTPCNHKISPLAA